MEKITYKPGDRVRITDNKNGSGVEIGAEGVLKTYFPGEAAHWSVRFDYGYTRYFSERRFELVEAYQDPITRLQSENERLREALENLIQLKDWKDKYGKDEHYTKHQPAAWEAARAALNQK